MKIDPIGNINVFKNDGVDKSESGDGTFTKMLGDKLQETQDLQNEADLTAQKLATGELTDVHTAMISAEKAELSLQYTLAIRNKLVEAYQDIMRMQI